MFTRDNRLWAIELMGGKIEPLTETTAETATYNAAFSPDGKWLAYIGSGAASRNQVYVQPFPKGAKYQVSREAANAPAWSRDGKELFYYLTDIGKFVSVRIQTQPSFSVSEPAEIPIDRMIQAPGSAREFDILPDGRFLVVLPAPQPGETESRPTQQINVVLNWFTELKQRVPVR